MIRVTMFLALLIASAGALADSASKARKMEELVSVMDMDAMVDSIYSQMEQMMQNMADDLNVTAQEQPLFDEYNNKMTLVMKTEMGWDKMKPLIIDVYAKHFSEHEVDGMLEFYRSEVGQSILDKMPVVMQESMLISQQLTRAAMPKIQSIAAELKQDLEKLRDGE